MKENPRNASSEIEPTDAIMPKPGAGVMGTDIAFPSEAYDRHCAAITYRISELIFGSLLASYILGFIAIGTNLRNGQPPIDTLSFIAVIAQSVCVSICFSYLTASAYLTYHSAILTMPHFQTSNLRWDFAIAILQAVAFGISIIYLPLFPIMVSLSLFAVFLRQKYAFVDLSEHFWTLGVRAKILKDERGDAQRREDKFQRAIQEIRQDEHFEGCMRGWLPVSPRLWKSSIWLLLVGFLNLALQYFAPQFTSIGKISWPSPAVAALLFQSILYVILAMSIFRACSHVFLQSHELIKNPEGSKNKLRIDDAVEELIARLRGPSSGQSK